MQTVQPSRKPAHDRNKTVVDLQEYRRRLEDVDGSLALSPPSEAAPRRSTRASRPARRRTLSDWLDVAATAILIAVAITVWIQLMG